MIDSVELIHPEVQLADICRINEAALTVEERIQWAGWQRARDGELRGRVRLQAACAVLSAVAGTLAWLFELHSDPAQVPDATPDVGGRHHRSESIHEPGHDANYRVDHYGDQLHDHGPGKPHTGHRRDPMMTRARTLIALAVAVATSLVLWAGPAAARECIDVMDGEGNWSVVCSGSPFFPEP